MNYVNVNEAGTHVFTLNSRVEDATSVDWIIYKEGSDSIEYTFTAPVIGGNYYQSVFLDSAEYTFKNTTFYRLEGEVNGARVYVGKIYATDGVLEPSSHNKDRYQEKPNTNDYIILE
jgi:hypothetical protein